jgi:hypothetical protein
MVVNPEGKRSLGRLRHRWEVNIKRDLKEIEWSVWTGLSWFMIGASGELL